MQASRHLLAKHWRIHALARPSGVETFRREATAPTVFRTLDKRRSRTPGRPPPPPTGARGILSTRSRKAQKGTTPWGTNDGQALAGDGNGHRRVSTVLSLFRCCEGVVETEKGIYWREQWIGPEHMEDEIEVPVA